MSGMTPKEREGLYLVLVHVWENGGPDAVRAMNLIREIRDDSRPETQPEQPSPGALGKEEKDDPKT